MAETTLHTGLIPVTATLGWKSGRTLPVVTLSFDGLNSPDELLAELAALGWEVPPVPPRPSSAIEWVPDPVLGTAYTVHPWTVEDFALGRPDWAPADGEEITAQTVSVLRRHGVGGDLPGSERELEPPTAVPDVAHRAPAPGTAPQLILLDHDGSAHPDFRSAHAETGGRKRVAVAWSESPHAPAVVCASPGARAELAADATHAWEVVYGRPPAVPTDPGQVAVCAAIPGVSADDPKLNKLVGMLGGDMQVAVLIPLNPTSGASGALVFGVVPANAAELAISTLRLKCSGSIVRVD